MALQFDALGNPVPDDGYGLLQAMQRLPSDPATAKEIDAANAAIKPVANPPPRQQLSKMSMPLSAVKPGFSANYGKQADEGFAENIDMRKEQLDALKDKLSKLEAAKPTGFAALDLKPFAAFADSLTGQNTAQNYGQPSSVKDYKEQVSKLQDQVEKASNSLSDDQLGYLKMKANEDKEKRLMAQFSNMNDYRAGRLSLLDDSFANKLGHQVENDELIKTVTTQNNNLAKAKATLAGGVITPGVLSEIENDLATALSGKGGATDHVRKNIEMGMWERSKADLMQKLTSHPEGVHAPEYMELLNHMVDRLSEANQIAIQRRLATYQSGADNLSSQKAKNVLGDKIKQLGGGQPAGNGMIQVTNGKETLQIAPEDLPHAMQDGYKQVK